MRPPRQSRRTSPSEFDRLQRALDLAIVKQALYDLRQPVPVLCRRDLEGGKVSQVLEAASWVFAGGDGGVFGFVEICERLGVDCTHAREAIAGQLPDERLDFLRAYGVGLGREVSG